MGVSKNDDLLGEHICSERRRHVGLFSFELLQMLGNSSIKRQCVLLSSKLFISSHTNEYCLHWLSFQPLLRTATVDWIRFIIMQQVKPWRNWKFLWDQNWFHIEISFNKVHVLLLHYLLDTYWTHHRVMQCLHTWNKRVLSIGVAVVAHLRALFLSQMWNHSHTPYLLPLTRVVLLYYDLDRVEFKTARSTLLIQNFWE